MAEMVQPWSRGELVRGFGKNPPSTPRLPAAARRHQADSRPAQNQFSLPLVGLGFRRYPRHILAFPETRFRECLALQGPIISTSAALPDRHAHVVQGCRGPMFLS